MYCKTLTSQGKKQGPGLYGFTYYFFGHVTCATRGYVTWEVLGAKQIIWVLEKINEVKGRLEKKRLHEYSSVNASYIILGCKSWRPL